MAYWLFKSEPNTWSFSDQLAKGEEGEGWGWCTKLSSR